MKLSDLPQALAELEKAARLRVPDDGVERQELQRKFGDRFIDAASNDYLGLAWGGGAPLPVSRETLDPSLDSLAGNPFGETARDLEVARDSQALGAKGSPNRKAPGAVELPSAGRDLVGRGVPEASSVAERIREELSREIIEHGPRSPDVSRGTFSPADDSVAARSFPLGDHLAAEQARGADLTGGLTQRGSSPPRGSDSRGSDTSAQGQAEAVGAADEEASETIQANSPPLTYSSPVRRAATSLASDSPSSTSIAPVSRETGVQGKDDQSAFLLSPQQTQGAIHSPSVGAGSSRLIFGTSPEHVLLEQELAAWVGLPASLLFASGYAANVGALAAILSPEDAVFSDSLNHASLIDGIRLSRARAQIVPHLDLAKLEEGLAESVSAPARWVICEAYYSMDGDGPNLAALRALCDRYDAQLYVDEAHSLGTFGPRGAGLCAAEGVVPDVLMAAFGKSVGSQGACVAGSSELRTWLWNRARSFVFSTAPSPLLVSTTRQQLQRTQAADRARSRLQSVCLEMRVALKQAGVSLVAGSFGPVLGLLMGAEERALLLAQRLRESGILAQAVRPPTVPVGASRVRLVLRASLTDEQTARLVEVVARETTS